MFYLVAIFWFWSVSAFADHFELQPGHSLGEVEILSILSLSSDDRDDQRRVWHFQQPVFPLRNNASSAVSFQIVQRNFNHDNGRLDAVLSAELGTGESSLLQISAQSSVEQLAPVPFHDLSKGSVIQPNDLDWIWINQRQLRQDTILHASDIIGMEVRRNLQAGRAVRGNMVEKIRHIRRGELVEVTYNRSGLLLSMVVEAIEDGSKGELVRLRNIDSGRRLFGRTTGEGTAMIVVGEAR